MAGMYVAVRGLTRVNALEPDYDSRTKSQLNLICDERNSDEHSFDMQLVSMAEQCWAPSAWQIGNWQYGNMAIPGRKMAEEII